MSIVKFPTRPYEKSINVGVTTVPLNKIAAVSIFGENGEHTALMHIHLVNGLMYVFEPGGKPEAKSLKTFYDELTKAINDSSINDTASEIKMDMTNCNHRELSASVIYPED